MPDQQTGPVDEISGINYMTLKEFRDGGFLHELNRLVLHPLGLALQVEMDPEDDESTRGSIRVWDYRDDPEGIYFDGGTLDAGKAITVCSELLTKRAERKERLGYVVQPIPGARVMTINYIDPNPPSVHPDLEFER